jgi:transcription elongation factor/antiterminator RfaH
MKRWYVIHSKPQKEMLLWEQLWLQRMETYYPCIQVHPVNPRASKTKAYFPGYLFIRVDLEQENISKLTWMPGAIGLVRFGGEPAVVPDTLLAEIQRKVEEINTAGGEILYGLKSGDPIVIREGPFEGYEAIFEARLPGSMRVKVLLELLQGRQLRMELPVEQIERTRGF